MKPKIKFDDNLKRWYIEGKSKFYKTAEDAVIASKSMDEDEEAEFTELTEDQLAFLNILGSMARINMIDWAALEKEDGITRDQATQMLSLVYDAKLSASARKNMPKSTFCDPANKGFPVPNCAHVTAARRLIGAAKHNEASKAKIRACIERKAKSLGCDSTNDHSQTIKELLSKLETYKD